MTELPERIRSLVVDNEVEQKQTWREIPGAPGFGIEIARAGQDIRPSALVMPKEAR